MSVIKICGLTHIEDATLSAECGADLLGLIFHRASARFVDPEEAAALVRAVQAPSVRWIGVFVDEKPDDILRSARTIGLQGVQLHGKEPPNVVDRLRGEGLFVIKAHRVSGSVDLARLDAFEADAHLLDAYAAEAAGGTGRTFDWSLAGDASTDRRVLLAGGLTPDNVAEAIRSVRPWGVDVSSGVEAAPGRKDSEKIRRFIAAARAAFDRGEGQDG